MSIPQSNLPPVVLAGDVSAESEHRRQRRVQRLTDAGIALLLLLTLGIVFLTDRRIAGQGRDLRPQCKLSERFLFDPLHEPIAEVRQNPQRQDWIGAYGGTAESEAAVRRGLDWLARHQMRPTATGVPTRSTPGPTAAARRATFAPAAAANTALP